MPLVSVGDILATHRAVAAFNVIQLEHAEAIVAGAQLAGLPVVLQISENTAKYHRGLAPLALAARRIAESSTVGVALHLDHAEDEELVTEALDLGMTSVMFDAAKLDYADNLRRTAAVAIAGRARGVWVEAELGEVGGKDGAHAPGVKTDPADATAFVTATGVDGLAVAVGSSHAMTTRTATLDFDLIARLRDAVRVPLVLHGSSGVSDADIVRAIDAGMRKVNIATHLNTLFTGAVRAELDRAPGLVDPRAYLGPARDAVADEVARLVTLITGRTA
ncbi:MAG: class II fructose-bisphosphate aldolase [Burkholderiaceae bacterium]|nr:class II fructose-bisphosphate aldolase [Microbacteriaceae bacterium]